MRPVSVLVVRRVWVGSHPTTAPMTMCHSWTHPPRDRERRPRAARKATEVGTALAAVRNQMSHRATASSLERRRLPDNQEPAREGHHYLYHLHRCRKLMLRHTRIRGTIFRNPMGSAQGAAGKRYPTLSTFPSVQVALRRCPWSLRPYPEAKMFGEKFARILRRPRTLTRRSTSVPSLGTLMANLPSSRVCRQIGHSTLCLGRLASGMFSPDSITLTRWHRPVSPDPDRVSPRQRPKQNR
mmetsp:Transcript_7114/g.19301  ORF Transcript_7114/g.19301 Transcript_7114/m.19301 type:complete len:240 (+) Transcript_7114:312-1031(+)